ncbi:hypothetical protein [Prevotella sp. 10(H)]|uniref:hypothetical protein n=1 Tax=Prevotella sp. 10(H) TaxID=1158294 RepID=UPI0004A754F5|nr:hypothetical protein [Prevotella sp. 10(H)]
MKKLLLAFALFIGAASLYNTAEAQNVNISINIGRQPAWGPVGYDYVGYYYFPDIDCYYDVNVGMFYYQNRGRWISARYLPYSYRNYDLYGMYKVVLNVHEPWRYHHNHYRDYARYRGHRNQIVIRDSRDHRYHSSRNNRVAWYSGNKKNNHRDDHKYNSGRPSYNNKKDKDHRKEYNANKSRDNKRPDYSNKNNRPDRKDNVKSRPSTSRENKRESSSRTVRSSSEKSNLRMASNTGSGRSSRR